VWTCDLRVSGSRLVEIERAQDLLTEAEKQRAAAITDSADRERWIAAHAALHLIFRSRIGAPVEFAPAAQGAGIKPSVVGWEGDFSLTHSGDLVLIAIAERGRAGIDAEIRRATKLDTRRRGMILAAGEAVGSAPLPAEPDVRILAAWNRLEALAKARGDGIGAVLEALGFHAAQSSETASAQAARRLLGEGAERLAVHDIDVARFDAVAALAQAADAEPPTIRDLSGELARLAG
jgi:4'-phosphopantetheinyl transferase